MTVGTLSSRRTRTRVAPGQWWRLTTRFVLDRFLLLPLGVVVAMLWANTAGESYFRFAYRSSFAVNEIGMALFLALVARDAYEAMMPGGALHSWRRLLTPIVVGLGGVIGAASTYLLCVTLKYESVLIPGWPAAIAVDVAAAFYLVKLIWGTRSMTAFALLAALASDALALGFGLTIQDLEFHAAAPLLMLLALGTAATIRRNPSASLWTYLLGPGVLSWTALYLTGIHPALALLPIIPFLPHRPRRGDAFADIGESPDDDREASEVHRFEHRWHEVAQVVVFAFGLVNGGMLLNGYGTASWAMLTAGAVGRPLGMIVALAIAPAIGLTLPARLRRLDVLLLGLALSGGFTFPLFFATSVIPLGPVLTEVKLGALMCVAAAGAALLLARVLRVGRFGRARH